MPAPEGNDLATGNPGGCPPEGNLNASTHGACIPDERIVERGQHDEFIERVVETSELPRDEAVSLACSLIRFDRAASHPVESEEEWCRMLTYQRREFREIVSLRRK